MNPSVSHRGCVSRGLEACEWVNELHTLSFQELETCEWGKKACKIYISRVWKHVSGVNEPQRLCLQILKAWKLVNEPKKVRFRGWKLKVIIPVWKKKK